MAKFNVKFRGRVRCAIGSFYWINDVVDADNADNVLVKLYEKYEHITGLTVVQIG